MQCGISCSRKAAARFQERRMRKAAASWDTCTSTTNPAASQRAGRMQPRGLLLLLALLLLAATAEAAKAKKAAASLAEKAKKEGSECQDWRWGPCVPNSKDCGLGYREGTCGDESRKLKCKIPCNWKKKFGADCKYKFESWGGCSAQTGVKTRSGILKKALYNAQCEEVVYVSKPCAAKMKAKAKAKKGKGKD
ncbi:midkine isoform X3 [Tympanuchus pallidicinctus]|uniref:midkine isoform X3 n=1 Tax=Tympanuchus pallidicinctus TaxID=109042 RepID=UPI0022875011|nr:midkine isoform X3 [Tympanuchus pallidicinctus]